MRREPKTSSYKELSKQGETGIGFQIVRSLKKYYAIFNGNETAELTDENTDHPVQELITLDNIPAFEISQVFENRQAALVALGNVSSRYAGGAGAFPLIKQYTLKQNTIFYRGISSPIDMRFTPDPLHDGQGKLSAGTYLTTELDKVYSNTGFAAVGRFALPIPLPAINSIQYELPQGTVIDVGTVAPMFGQSGGGVEVLLVADTTVTCHGVHVLPDF